MSWFVGTTLSSFVVAFIVVRLFDYLFSGVVSGFTSVARAGLFVGSWTAVTAGTGMQAFSKRVRQLRQRIIGVNRA